jgi:glycine/D-amino acid oxidase-like deaminating enzyme
LNPDLVIVGAGLAGASVAWHLGADCKVLLVDQGPRFGAEASGQNAGMLRRLGEDPYERKLAQRSHLFLQNPGEDWEGLQPSRKTGALMLLAHDPHHLEDGLSHLRATGVPIEMVANPKKLAHFLKKDRFCKSIFLPDERSCDSADLLTGFVKGATKKGMQLSLGTTVQELIIKNGKVQGVKTDKETVYCGEIVLAAGAWSSILAARSGLNRPIVPLRRSLFFTGPHPLFRENHPWVWVDDAGIYARPYDQGFLISPCDEFVDWPKQGTSSWGNTDENQRRLLLEKISAFFPGLSQSRLQHSWTGLRSFAPDRRPFLGPDQEVEGLWWAAGLGGFGLSCSVGVGEALSTWIRGEQTPWLDARMVSPNRALSSKWLIRPSGEIHKARLISTPKTSNYSEN